MGNRYERSEWPEFLGLDREACLKFQAAAVSLWEVSHDSLGTEEEYELGFLTFCSIVGHGVGLWDGGDERLGVAEGTAQPFEAAARSSKALCALAYEADLRESEARNA